MSEKKKVFWWGDDVLSAGKILTAHIRTSSSIAAGGYNLVGNQLNGIINNPALVWRLTSGKFSFEVEPPI